VIRSPRLGLSLRTRLTLWYGALLALTLLAFSALLYFTLERSLSASVDDALRLRADQLRRSVLGPNIGILLQPEDIPPGQVEASPLDEFAAPGIYPQVLNARGAVVFAPPNLPGGELPVTEAMVEATRAGRETLLPVPVGDTNVRVLTVPLRGLGGEVVGAVQVGQSLAPVESTMAAVARLLFLGGAGALLLATVLGGLFTHRALSPVARITATARHIAATGDYRQRLPAARPGTRGGDELVSLARTFNDMIARLEHLLESQRRLLADTSHELRTPLTVIRGNLALLRREAVPPETWREAVLEADEEAVRMGRLVNDLLLVARADAGQLPSLQRQPVDLGELIREVTDQARPGAGGRTLAVAVPGPVTVLGDRDRLKQLVANLVENAVRYTPEGGRIHLGVAVGPAAPAAQHPAPPARSPSGEAPVATALLTVTDTGIGIAPEHLPHLFRRFYRADKARSRTDGGAGLGLAIAQYIAQAHGGTIEAASAGLGRGSSFRVRLPLWSPAARPERAAPVAGSVGREPGDGRSPGAPAGPPPGSAPR
jgi:signal transduction histidine kinase